MARKAFKSEIRAYATFFKYGKDVFNVNISDTFFSSNLKSFKNVLFKLLFIILIFELYDVLLFFIFDKS